MPTLEERQEELRKALNVASLNNTFDNFKPLPGTKEALAAFKALALGKTRWKMLLCYGGVGNGKTHLLEAMAIEHYKRRLFSRVMTMATMMDTLKKTMGKDSNITYDGLKSVYSNADRLLVDDVGMGGSGSDWSWSQLEEIMVVRYRERLLTVMTSNLKLEDIPTRIVSRFQDPEVGRVVLNQGADYRRVKARNETI